MARIAVFGIGNVLTGDDAVGPYVVKVLEARWELPGVEVVDAGTPGLDLTAYFAGLDAAILVDAVKARAAPGELRTYSREDLVKRSPVLAVSPHEPGLREAVMNAEFMGVCPATVRLVGVVAERTDLGCALSPSVQAAVPAAVEQVLSELRALGVAPRPRDPPVEPDLWWEKGRAG